MYKKYILSSIRFLSRNLGYTVLNITGLSIGVAVSVLLFIYVFDELTYDRFHEKKDHIYLVSRDGCREGNQYTTGSTSPPTAEALKQDFPEIENFTRIIDWYEKGIYMKYKEELVPNLKFLGVDSSFFNVFTTEFIHGNPKNALTEPNTVVLTESTALKFFDSVNPLGKTISTLSGGNYTIKGVIKDFPKSSHLEFDILYSIYSVKDYGNPRSWFSHNSYTYINLNKNANAEKLEAKLPYFTKKHLGPLVLQVTGKTFDEFFSNGDYYSFFLTPLKNVYLSSLYGTNNEGKKSFIIILGIVGVLVLILACINYINLSTAMSSTRQMDIGIKKTFGAQKPQLRKQFIIESIIISFISVSFGMLIIEVLLPYYNNLVIKSYKIDYFSNPIILPGLIIFSMLIGILSGLYPAFIMSSQSTILILARKIGISSKNQKNWFRNILVIIQFAICIGIMIFTIIINQQLKFVLNKDLGFNKNHVLIIDMIDGLGNNRYIFKENLLRNPKIKNVSLANSTPFRHLDESGHHAIGRPNNEIHFFHTFWADYDIYETLEIEIIQGRKLSEEYSEDKYGVIINEAALKQLNFDNPLEIKFDMLPFPLEDTAIFSVKGVFKDFHFTSLHTKIQDMAIYPIGGIDWYADCALIKLSDQNITETIKNIKKEYNSLTSYPFQYKFLNDDFNELYLKEQKAKKLLLLSTIISIFIASLGLIGLASFIINKKTKEIGIRKAMGASPYSIARLLIKQFSIWIIMANIIAWPIAYYFVKKWLANFAYHINLNPLVFLIVGISTLLIAIFTISFHTYLASTKNPVDTLRYE